MLTCLGATEGIPAALEALGSLAGAQGRWTRSAHLLGAAEVLRETLGTPLPPAERVPHDATVNAARGGIGEAAFRDASAEGRAMAMGEAVAYALCRESPPAPE
ncbi:MAG: hypothetical protein M3Q29_22035 [Chloroflexota bacterium]|nr:hypothetical protein [Chloroflexota bacterium]